VTQNFLSCDRDQEYMLPPSITDWLPESHPVWFFIEAIESMRPKFGAFYARYRSDGWGRAAFEPTMMVTLLCYAYFNKVISSRQIERHCRQDIAFRAITANRMPDHATIARFRQANWDSMKSLFTEVLRACREAGLVSAGLIAIDGTKIAASASSKRNRSAEQIDKELAQLELEIAEDMLSQAEAADAADDERLGPDAAGGEMPEAVATKKARAEWLRQRRQKLDDDEAARHADHEARKASHKQARAQGSEEAPPRPPRPPRSGKPRVNLTDPDSKTMKCPGGYLQGYNAQAAVNEHQIIVATDVTNAAADVYQFEPMAASAQANLAEVGADRMARVVADTGYYCDHNARLDLGADVLICPSFRDEADLEEALAAEVARAAAEAEYQAKLREIEELADRRVAVLDRVIAGEITRQDAAVLLGSCLSHVHTLLRRYRARGRDGITPKRLPPRPRSDPRLRMRDKLSSEEGRAAYRQRSQTVEPVFGQIKEGRGFRQFSCRGLRACKGEWDLIGAVHNLAKLMRSGGKHAPSPHTTTSRGSQPSRGPRRSRLRRGWSSPLRLRSALLQAH
jgi:transposase